MASATFTPTAAADDGFVRGRDAGYAIAHSTAYGSAGEPLTIGQDYVTRPFIMYYVDRSFIAFDTSIIPNGAVITFAKLRLYGVLDYFVTDVVLRLQKWTGSPPVGMEDFNLFDGVNYDDGNFNTTGWVTLGWNEIIVSNFDLIIKEGTTKICVRSSKDISSTAPTGGEYGDGDAKEGEHPPELYVEWTPPVAPPAKPLISKPLINPVLVNTPLIR